MEGSPVRTNHTPHIQARGLWKKYWPLIKSFQTGLLLITGIAGYLSARCPIANWKTILALSASLFLAISGSTVLNMWYDRDIDAQMKRTSNRPLPSGAVQPKEAFWLGLFLSASGVIWALAIDWLFGVVVFAGLFFDVVVYTIWLKRRSAWSIVWGGISGGMPILAGRALGVGAIDWVGIALAASVLFWIPTHIMTFNIRYLQDYKLAGIPTFPEKYGINATQKIIAASSLLAALAMSLSGLGIGLMIGYLRVMVVLSAGLLGLAATTMIRPSEHSNFALFKYASVYMLSAMLLLSFEGL
ncbi:heme o synthase [bacterium]|nr:heme o synthase [bacterium]